MSEYPDTAYDLVLHLTELLHVRFISIIEYMIRQPARRTLSAARVFGWSFEKIPYVYCAAFHTPYAQECASFYTVLNTHQDGVLDLLRIRGDGILLALSNPL